MVKYVLAARRRVALSLSVHPSCGGTCMRGRGMKVEVRSLEQADARGKSLLSRRKPLEPAVSCPPRLTEVEMQEVEQPPPLLHKRNMQFSLPRCSGLQKEG